MNRNKKDQIIKKLENIASEKGILTYDDINNVLEEGFTDFEIMDEIFIELKKRGIEIADKEKKTKTKPEKQNAAKKTKKDQNVSNEEINPLNKYLTDIQKIDFISAKDEKNLVKKIENANTEIKEIILQTPFSQDILSFDKEAVNLIKEKIFSFNKIYDNIKTQSFLLEKKYKSNTEELKNLYYKYQSYTTKDQLKKLEDIYGFDFNYFKHSIKNYLTTENELSNIEKKYNILREDIQYWAEKITSLQNIINKAKEKLISTHLKLVIYIAKKYAKKLKVNFADLIQDGNAGLVKAVNNFSTKSGYRLSTYATWWIRKHIKKGINQYNKFISIPNKLQKKIKVFIREKNYLTQVMKRIPTDNELAKHLNWSVKEIKDLQNSYKEPISFELPARDTEGLTLKDLIEEKTFPTPSAMNERNTVKEKLTEMLSHLPQKEKEVITLKFGLTDNYTYSYAEIAQKLKLSIDDVKKLYQKGMTKLKSSDNLGELKDYL